MSVNTFSLAVLALALTVSAAQAETIQISPNAQATIQGHHASSVFLPGAFFSAPINNLEDDDGSSAASNAVSNVLSQTDGDDARGGTSDGGDRDPDLSGLGPNGGTIAQSPAIGTVPLPPALPLFGAALLMVGGLSVVRRKRRNA